MLSEQVQASTVAGSRRARSRRRCRRRSTRLERECRELHAKALALVRAVEACARLIRRELGVRRRGAVSRWRRRRSMRRLTATAQGSRAVRRGLSRRRHEHPLMRG